MYSTHRASKTFAWQLVLGYIVATQKHVRLVTLTDSNNNLLLTLSLVHRGMLLHFLETS